MLHCTRCEGTGFLNLHQVPEGYTSCEEDIFTWANDNADHDVQVCDCCGDGEQWHGVKGAHYAVEDPRGSEGPYAYNGGLCECH